MTVHRSIYHQTPLKDYLISCFCGFIGLATLETYNLTVIICNNESRKMDEGIEYEKLLRLKDFRLEIAVQTNYLMKSFITFDNRLPKKKEKKQLITGLNCH